MAAKARIFKSGNAVDYTPASAVTGGTPTQIAGGLVGVPNQDVAASATAGFRVEGVFNIACTVAVGNAGDNVWWDANGSPYGGTALSGACTTIASDGDFWLGILAEDSGATDADSKVILNVENPDLPAWVSRVHETVSADLTLDVQDSGKVLHVDTDAKVITLLSR